MLFSSEYFLSQAVSFITTAVQLRDLVMSNEMTAC